MTQQTLGGDYSSARPDPKALKAAGWVGVGRYIALGTSDKWLTPAERDALHGEGLGIWLVAEGGAQRATAGFDAGASDARAALAVAGLLRAPADCPIFCAVDFDASVGQVLGYLRGWASVLGKRAGVYGGIKITGAFRVRRLIPYRWQTAAWSAGKVDGKAHIYQRVKPTHPVPGCDENVILRPFPMWLPATAARPAPKPAPKPKPPAPKPPLTRGPNVDPAIRSLRKATSRAAKAALKTLLRIRPWHKRRK